MSGRVYFRFLGLVSSSAESASLAVEWSMQASGMRLGQLGELAQLAAGRQVLLLAPSQEVVLRSHRFPGRRRSVWRQALPFALEDVLAEPVDDLHFVLGPSLPDDNVAVTAVRRARFDIWRTHCESVGLLLSAIVPDVLCLPWAEGTWSLVAVDDTYLVRTATYGGFACADTALPDVLALALAQTGPAPKNLQCWGPLPAQLELDVEIVSQAAKPLTELACETLDRPRARLFDLLDSNRTQRATTFGGRLKPFRWAAALVVLLLGILLAGQGVELWQLKHRQATLQQEIDRLFKQALPSARRMVNPRVQIENELKQLQARNGSQQDFFRLLAIGGRGVHNAESIALAALQYRNGRMDFQLLGQRLEAFDRLDKDLRAANEGVVVEMQSRWRDHMVESRLSLSTRR